MQLNVEEKNNKSVGGLRFKPMLCPNEKVDLSSINYPLLASTKLDGIRCIFMDGRMVSRTLKEIPNKQLQEKMQKLKDYSREHKVILDGEIYGIGMKFQAIMHFVMTEDLESEELPDGLKFFCFDAIPNNPEESFISRSNFIKNLKLDNLVVVKQYEVYSKEDVEAMFNVALDGGYEGLVLKSLTGNYKFGRATIKSGDAYKVKPFLTFDGKIIGVEERFENTSDSYTDELGHSKKHDLKYCKKSTGIAGVFVVMCDGREEKVVITGEEAFRREVWENQNNYIGKWIAFKGMVVGSKDKLRHTVFIRMREGK
jgi:DNA ligase-1